MRINHILFFLTMIFLSACKSKKAPDNIIPRDRMVNLLIDVHVIDGTIVAGNQHPDSLYKYGMGKFLHLFKTYHTDTTQFRRSVIYYAQQPELFDQMYDQITKALNAKVDSLNKVRFAIAKTDSAKNAQRTKHLTDSAAKARQTNTAPVKKGELSN